jgi:transcription factor Sp4
MPQYQQMVSVQVPVSQNGQTVYQTMQMPVQNMAAQQQTQLVPQLVQTSTGQQIVMTQVMQQPQFAQPQFAQIMMPGGQIQQVQLMGMQGQGQVMAGAGGGFQVIGSAGGGGFPIQIQQASQMAATSPITTTAAMPTSLSFSTGTSTTASNAITMSTMSTTQPPLLQPKQEPIDPSEAKDESDMVEASKTSSAIANLSTLMPVPPPQAAQQSPQQPQPHQQIMMTANGQQFIVQHPQQHPQQQQQQLQQAAVQQAAVQQAVVQQAAAAQQAAVQQAAVQQAQVLSVRTPNGQVVIPNMASAGSAPVTASAGTTINIPGLGNVQVVQQMPAAAAPAVSQAQLLSPGGQIQTLGGVQPMATQQALQQDPNDPNKWHVVQVATAQPAQMATAQVVTAAAAPTEASVVVGGDGHSVVVGVGSSTPLSGHSGIERGGRHGGGSKTRLRRVACTCPNCKDGDRSRSK